MLTPTQTPFKNIGLALSGGGFRAVAFSLGSLSYLESLKQENEVPLLHNVSYISSASGGSIVNSLYALYNANGKTFNEFYAFLFEKIEGVTMIDEALRVLNDDSEWQKHPQKKRNLINAFAISYNKFLYNDASAGELIKKNPTTHLDEICLNTADFFRGLLFRQALKLKPDSKDDDGFLYGNYMLHFKDNQGYGKGIQYKIKLGDMLAASSCFPGGFEPILFPDDFANNEITKDQLLKGLHVELQELKWAELDLIFSKSDAQPVVNATGNY